MGLHRFRLHQTLLFAPISLGVLVVGSRADHLRKADAPPIGDENIT